MSRLQLNTDLIEENLDGLIEWNWNWRIKEQRKRFRNANTMRILSTFNNNNNPLSNITCSLFKKRYTNSMKWIEVWVRWADRSSSTNLGYPIQFFWTSGVLIQFKSYSHTKYFICGSLPPYFTLLIRLSPEWLINLQINTTRPDEMNTAEQLITFDHKFQRDQ